MNIQIEIAKAHLVIISQVAFCQSQAAGVEVGDSSTRKKIWGELNRHATLAAQRLGELSCSECDLHDDESCICMTCPTCQGEGEVAESGKVESAKGARDDRE